MKRLFLLLTRLASQPLSWARAITRRSRLEAEMEAELASHLNLLTADLIRLGQPPAEARRNARIALGSAVDAKEGMRRSLGLRLWDDLYADVRYGARMLRKSPGFTFIAAFSLALAIGANTTIFSLARQILYQRLAVPHPETLRLLAWAGDDHVVVHAMWGEWDNLPGSGIQCTSFSYPVYHQLQARSAAAGLNLAAFKDDTMNATVAGEARSAEAEFVSGNFYDLVGVRTQLGRSIQPSDDAIPGSGAVAVISDGLWARQYGRSPSVLGQTLRLNQAVVTIVGVNPPGFTGAKSVQQSPDIFIPLSMQPVVDPKGENSLIEDQEMWWLNSIGRIAPGIPDTQAQAALGAAFQAAVRATLPLKTGDSLPRLVLSDGSRGMHPTDNLFRKPLYVLLTMTGFVLLLACVNIANLMLARGAHRQREMSVRLALGAGRRRILRQMLTESLMLSLLGGISGMFLAYLGRNVLPSLLSNPWENNALNVPFDWLVFTFAAAVTLATGLLFGLAPAFGAARAEVGTALKDTAQTTTRRRKGLGGKSIVGFQVALSTLLVIGALLFLRTLFALNTINVGFPTDHLLLFGINPPSLRYPDGKDIQLYQRLEQAFAAIPGVQSVAASDPPLLSGNMSVTGFSIEGAKSAKQNLPPQKRLAVGNDFFHTMGVPITAGRSFGPQDTTTSAKVAIINQALAKERFPGINPLGKRFSTAGDKGPWIEIVGISADTRYASLRDPAPAQFFLPYIQMEKRDGLTYELRTQLDPSTLVPTLRRTVAAIDPDLPLVDIRTQQEQIDSMMQMERTFAALTAGFGLLALSLACVGIYGVMAYSVSNRTNEIGIRLALGAMPRQVLAMVLRESTWISLAGVAIGLGAAALLTRLVKSMLYGLEPTDPFSLAGGAALLLVVGLAASWIPAHRAAAVQPMEALRHD